MTPDINESERKQSEQKTCKTKIRKHFLKTNSVKVVVRISFELKKSNRQK